jgi:cytidylate kinase
MTVEHGKEVERKEESPRHGFPGERPAPPGFPASLSIAVTREAGSRGGTIARRVGRTLGWQVYNQELLDYIAQEGAFTEGVVTNLSPEASLWAEERLQQLLPRQDISAHPTVADLARIVLALGAQGEVVLLGRGAGCFLPRDTTLHVRIMAPLEDRIAYMSQWLRLTIDEATAQVRLRDSRRSDFVRTHFQREAGDVHQYDLVLNSSFLGEDTCVELIAQAARAKLVARGQWAGAPPPWVAETVE